MASSELHQFNYLPRGFLCLFCQPAAVQGSSIFVICILFSAARLYEQVMSAEKTTIVAAMSMSTELE